MSKLGDIADATADANQAADLRHQLLTREIRGLKRTIKVLVVAFILIWGLSGLFYEKLEVYFNPTNAMYKVANAAIVNDNPNVIRHLYHVGDGMKKDFIERCFERNCPQILQAIYSEADLMAIPVIKLAMKDWNPDKNHIEKDRTTIGLLKMIAHGVERIETNEPQTVPLSDFKDLKNAYDQQAGRLEDIRKAYADLVYAFKQAKPELFNK